MAEIIEEMAARYAIDPERIETGWTWTKLDACWTAYSSKIEKQNRMAKREMGK